MSIQVRRLPSSERSARMHDVGTQATLYPSSVSLSLFPLSVIMVMPLAECRLFPDGETKCGAAFEASPYIN